MVKDNVVPSWESEFVVRPVPGGSISPAVLQEMGGEYTLASAPGWEACQGGAAKGWKKGR